MVAPITSNLKKLNNKELIKALSEECSLSQNDCSLVVESLTKIITGALIQEDKVTLSGFGTFSTRFRQRRQGRNPQTGEAITIPAAKVPRFKPGKNLKDKVNNK